MPRVERGGWLVLSGDKEKNGSGTRRNQDHSVFDVSEPLQLADRLPGLLWRKAHLSAQLPVRVLVSDSAIGFGDRGELIENHSGGDLRCVHEKNTTGDRSGCKAKDLQIDITDEEWQPMQAGLLNLHEAIAVKSLLLVVIVISCDAQPKPGGCG